MPRIGIRLDLLRPSETVPPESLGSSRTNRGQEKDRQGQGDIQSRTWRSVETSLGYKTPEENWAALTDVYCNFFLSVICSTIFHSSEMLILLKCYFWLTIASQFPSKLPAKPPRQPEPLQFSMPYAPTRSWHSRRIWAVIFCLYIGRENQLIQWTCPDLQYLKTLIVWIEKRTLLNSDDVQTLFSRAQAFYLSMLGGVSCIMTWLHCA